MLVPANTVMNWAIWYLYTAYTLHFVFLLVVCNTGMNGCLEIESLNYNLHWCHCVQLLAPPPFHSWDRAKHGEKIKARMENALTVASTRKRVHFTIFAFQTQMNVKKLRLFRYRIILDILNKYWPWVWRDVTYNYEVKLAS